MALLLLSAAGALVSFFGSIGPAVTASSETQVVEIWGAYGYLEEIRNSCRKWDSNPHGLAPTGF
jgi:hypothetical protein